MSVIQYKKGCLIRAALKGEVNVIAHQANCFNTMKSGVALAIIKAFPGAKDADSATIRGDQDKLGKFSVYYDEDSDTMVYNLYGQFLYGTDRQHTDYRALETALTGMAQQLYDCSTYEDIRVGLPLIGCGLAGGAWEVVSSIIEKAFKDVEIPITVYSWEG